MLAFLYMHYRQTSEHIDICLILKTKYINTATAKHVLKDNKTVTFNCNGVNSKICYILAKVNKQ